MKSRTTSINFVKCSHDISQSVVFEAKFACINNNEIIFAWLMRICSIALDSRTACPLIEGTEKIFIRVACTPSEWVQVTFAAKFLAANSIHQTIKKYSAGS
jgi:hypothetical protein